jgi:hypothetical protein
MFDSLHTSGVSGASAETDERSRMRGGEGVVSNESRRDWYPRQEAGQQLRPSQPRPQPQYGQQDWEPNQDQPPYSPYDRQPPQPSFTPNPQYGYEAPPRQSQYQGHAQYQGIPRGQPYPQAPPLWYDAELHRQHPHDQFRQQQAGSGPPHHRKRSRGLVYAVIAGLLVIAGAGAAYALVSDRTSAASAAQPLTCKQQYDAWKTGPAHAQGKQLDTDLNKVSAAGSAEDITALTSALEAAGAEAGVLERYPMPACADPHGYWGQVLAHIKAAGDNAGSASGLGGILLAEAPLKQVPGLEQKLSAEMKRAAIAVNN